MFVEWTSKLVNYIIIIYLFNVSWKAEIRSFLSLHIKSIGL